MLEVNNPRWLDNFYFFIKVFYSVVDIFSKYKELSDLKHANHLKCKW